MPATSLGPARAETWTIEDDWDQLVSVSRKGFAPPHFQYCDGTRFWKGMPRANDGWHLAGGHEHDELPGKIASLIVNLVDSCLAGIYLQSALAGVSPIPPKAVGVSKAKALPQAPGAIQLEVGSAAVTSFLTLLTGGMARRSAAKTSLQR